MVFTHINRDDNRMDIFRECGLNPMKNDERFQEAFWKRLNEIEMGKKFSDTIREEKLITYDCNEDVLLHNIIAKPAEAFDGVLFLRFDKETLKIVDEVWG